MVHRSRAAARYRARWRSQPCCLRSLPPRPRRVAAAALRRRAVRGELFDLLEVGLDLRRPPRDLRLVFLRLELSQPVAGLHLKEEEGRGKVGGRGGGCDHATTATTPRHHGGSRTPPGQRGPPAYAGLAPAPAPRRPQRRRPPSPAGGACVPLRSTESRIPGTPSKSVTASRRRCSPPAARRRRRPSRPRAARRLDRRGRRARDGARRRRRVAGSGFASPFCGVCGGRSVGQWWHARGRCAAGRRAGRAAHLAHRAVGEHRASGRLRCPPCSSAAPTGAAMSGGAGRGRRGASAGVVARWVASRGWRSEEARRRARPRVEPPQPISERNSATTAR